jgi:dynein heavy chain
MAPSIPSWKYFIFGGSVGSFEEGGNRTSSRYVDDTFYLDVDEMEWRAVELENEEDGKHVLKPKPREQPAIFYDLYEQRVIVYGGWSNNWLSDMWSLNVSMITGPPYAIFSIKPALGPLTGKTKSVIKGEGFKNTQNIAVKFYVGK